MSPFYKNNVNYNLTFDINYFRAYKYFMKKLNTRSSPNMAHVVAINLIYYMTINQISPPELAKKSGITRQTLWYIIKGKSWLSLETAFKLSNALSIDHFKLFETDTSVDPK